MISRIVPISNNTRITEIQCRTGVIIAHRRFGKKYRPLYRREIKKEDLPKICADCPDLPHCDELCEVALDFVDQGQRKSLREVLVEDLDYRAGQAGVDHDW